MSTRGDAPPMDFAGALMAGLAADGGLYVPAEIPSLDQDRLRALSGAPYHEIAAEVLAPFVSPCIPTDELADLTRDAYATFGHPDVAPLRSLGEGEYLLELFWGPTFAFKDVALQLLGRLFERELAAQGTRITVIGATSGDTGSAAIEACRGRTGIELVMLHPLGRVSDMQRRQMTTVPDENIHNLAIEGTFDDCQDLVKAMFADRILSERLGLAAVNSINWARIAAQTAYYVSTWLALGGPGTELSFAVPTGNFGNVLAGHLARRMGVAVDQLVVATNRNDILSRFLGQGDMSIRSVEPSLSPAMDIQVSSNFERLLYEAMDERGDAVAAAMAGFRMTGRLELPEGTTRRIQGLMSAGSCDDAETLATIGSVYSEHGLLIDPHTAVGVAVGRRLRREGPDRPPLVMLATAHPAKFSEAVVEATGVEPEMPERLAALAELPERCATLPNDLGAVVRHVVEVSGR